MSQYMLALVARRLSLYVDAMARLLVNHQNAHMERVMLRQKFLH